MGDSSRFSIEEKKMKAVADRCKLFFSCGWRLHEDSGIIHNEHINIKGETIIWRIKTVKNRWTRTQQGQKIAYPWPYGRVSPLRPSTMAFVDDKNNAWRHWCLQRIPPFQLRAKKIARGKLRGGRKCWRMTVEELDTSAMFLNGGPCFWNTSSVKSEGNCPKRCSGKRKWNELPAETAGI